MRLTSITHVSYAELSRRNEMFVFINIDHCYLNFLIDISVNFHINFINFCQFSTSNSSNGTISALVIIRELTSLEGELINDNQDQDNQS